jgi:hypothetical protein
MEEPTPCSVEEGLGERGKTGGPRPSSRRRGDGTHRRSGDPKQGRSRRQPRSGRRAKTRRITSAPGKAAGVGETGGSGRSSEEERDNMTLSEQRTRGPRWLPNWPEAGWLRMPAEYAGGRTGNEDHVKPWDRRGYADLALQLGVTLGRAWLITCTLA